jgi:hypothetical protein
MNDPINIEAIIELLRQQEPDRTDIIEALQNTTGGRWTNNGYYSFVDSANANQPGADWQFDENIILEQVEKGDVVLDILKGGRVGGIEFIAQIDK